MSDRWTKLMADLDDIQHTLRRPGLTPATVGNLVHQAEDLYGRASRELMRVDLYSSVRRISPPAMERNVGQAEEDDSPTNSQKTRRVSRGQ